MTSYSLKSLTGSILSVLMRKKLDSFHSSYRLRKLTTFFLYSSFLPVHLNKKPNTYIRVLIYWAALT